MDILLHCALACCHFMSGGSEEEKKEAEKNELWQKITRTGKQNELHVIQRKDVTKYCNFDGINFRNGPETGRSVDPRWMVAHSRKRKFAGNQAIRRRRNTRVRIGGKRRIVLTSRHR